MGEKAECLAGKTHDRRAVQRLGVYADASLVILKSGLSMPCQITDLSLNGCRIQTRERFVAGSLIRVEVIFRVRGLALQFDGITQWTDGNRVAGIRFVDMSLRRRNELVEVLVELKEANASTAKIEAAEAPAAEEEAAAQPVRKQSEEEPAKERAPERSPNAGPKTETTATLYILPNYPLASAPKKAQDIASWQDTKSQNTNSPEVNGPPSAKPSKRERRAQSRHEVDTSAAIYLINIGTMLPGRILDLSLSGCHIRTDERFAVGIYTRVETEFRLRGLPFRLGGVIQAVHDRDRYNVGIRFLDVSARKREQVEQLIQEIEEMRTRQDSADTESRGRNADG